MAVALLRLPSSPPAERHLAALGPPDFPSPPPTPQPQSEHPAQRRGGNCSDLAGLLALFALAARALASATAADLAEAAALLAAAFFAALAARRRFASSGSTGPPASWSEEQGGQCGK